MTEEITTKRGRVVEYQGKYWGIQRADGYCTVEGYGPIEKATISNYDGPTTHLTYKGSYNETALSIGKWRKVSVTTIYMVEDDD